MEVGGLRKAVSCVTDVDICLTRHVFSITLEADFAGAQAYLDWENKDNGKS